MPVITALMAHTENEGERTEYVLLCLGGIKEHRVRLGVVGMKYFVLLRCWARSRR